ncbi:MAG: hypothetical protein E7180_04230 [Erysipelotrichaceae bacterium]|nr:hypothetical protein [Erysipelotrichaceae bacterium]
MKIGVVTRILYEDGVEKEFVNTSYLKMLNKYSFTPIIISCHSYKEEVLDMCDGFLLPGGDDIDARYFEQENHPSNVLVSPIVDEVDFKVLDYAIRNNKAVLGICRGLQVINVFFKGTLVQDILDQSHKNNKEDKMLVLSSSRFTSFQNKEVVINSFHHQKIDKLGEGLMVEGISNDAIELITHENYKLIASQYHLEKLDNEFEKEVMQFFVALTNQ